MSWIENVRQKSQKEKIKLIYIICGCVAGALLILWILTTQIGKLGPADNTLFQTISTGVKNWNNR